MAEFSVFNSDPPWKKVTREEFRAFIAAYKPSLTHEATTICEPVFHGYYDMSRLPEQDDKGHPHPAITEALRAKCWMAEREGEEDCFYVRSE